ncbi:BPTI/Kunitz-type proteinase inhibitor domain-containing protein [Hymenobacter tibetensis]|uniref:BPTI/Kunitz-type proteinase inhibitor domain-containing protein n=1 Tax=Hymenobacter tibetensis TaxID=497967 RepID=UPI00374D1D97
MKYALLLSTAALLASATSCQQEKDSPEPASQPSACALVPDAGLCNAAFVRYYFDPKEKKCKQFV